MIKTWQLATLCRKQILEIKRDLVENMFFHVDVEVIMRIPQGVSDHHHMLIWHYTLDWKFSVKLAYHLVMKLRKKDEWRGPINDR